MKIKHLTKKLIVITLLIAVSSCTKEDNFNPEIDSLQPQKNNYTIQYENNTNNAVNTRSNINAPNKYLKVVYPSNGSKLMVRNAIFNVFESSQYIGNYSYNLIEINTPSDPNTDIWVFDEIFQSDIDSLLGIDGSLCLYCNHVSETEYVTVIDLCYEESTSMSDKHQTRVDFEELLHVIVSGNCEKWIMRGCCIGQGTCDRIGDFQYDYPIISDTVLQD